MTAKVIADSISPHGIRLTTMEVVMHRFVLAEFNTHRVFSRNSASSRAIPVEKQLRRVKDNPTYPLVWACEQPGMQGGNELEGWERGDAQLLFDMVRNFTVAAVEEYLDKHQDKSIRLHKSLINRLLEPFMWHTVIVSSTDWLGFWEQRCSPLAQPEIRVVAEAMKEAYENSTPVELSYGEWHTPYADAGEIPDDVLRCKASAARIARVSRENHDTGTVDVDKDLDTFNKLATAKPGHWSPLEHVATPHAYDYGEHVGNFRGWDQLRHFYDSLREGK